MAQMAKGLLRERGGKPRDRTQARGQRLGVQRESVEGRTQFGRLAIGGKPGDRAQGREHRVGGQRRSMHKVWKDARSLAGWLSLG